MGGLLIKNTDVLLPRRNGLDLVYLCTMTAAVEKIIGAITTENINVTECSSGRIVFYCTDSALTTDKVWSGLINKIRFKSKISGRNVVSVTKE